MARRRGNSFLGTVADFMGFNNRRTFLNSSALQGRWLEEPEGFPTHVSFRKGNKRVVTPPQGERKGCYAPWV